MKRRGIGFLLTLVLTLTITMTSSFALAHEHDEQCTHDDYIYYEQEDPSVADVVVNEFMQQQNIDLNEALSEAAACSHSSYTWYTLSSTKTFDSGYDGYCYKIASQEVKMCNSCGITLEYNSRTQYYYCNF